MFGAKIEAMFPFGDGPPEMQVPADYKTKIMHARVTIDGEVLMASGAATSRRRGAFGLAAGRGRDRC